MAVCPSATGLLLVVLMRVLCSSHAHTFYVGGHDGWTLKPSEKYSHWAERYRFQINDELLFRYKKGQDSVLVVSKDDYSKCNKDNPIKNLKDGDSKFKFEKSGPFFFISGHDQNCEKGEKFIVVVLSHHHHGTPVSAPSLSPEAHLRPPSSSPSPSPTTVKTVPPVKPPNKAPAPAPSAHQTPTPLLEPEAPTHAPPPSHSASPAPAAETPSRPFQPRSHSPSPSPEAKTPTDSPPVESPSHSLPPSLAAESPSDHVGPHSHSPSTSPVAKTPSDGPPVGPPYYHSPSPSSHKEAPAPSRIPDHHSPSPSSQSPKNNHGAPQPNLEHHHIASPPYGNAPVFPPNHAPALAPSAAANFGGSFVLLVVFTFAVTMVSASFV
ncbi:UNVERIFIED_CONTAM: Early nodulin-like protein 2 [Sesamum angustifolium]|uniref:Early nodulin-like protein 2 n=1 Tax=Sesamum angustifolium TaxID=2727405 RepID=A0AAW2PG63_9LAMI